MERKKPNSRWQIRKLAFKEAKCLDTDILGLSETILTGEDKMTHEGYNLIYSGGTEHQHGVGILLIQVSHGPLGS